MSKENVELVRAAWQAVVQEWEMVVRGRGSDVRIEADETDVFWFATE